MELWQGGILILNQVGMNSYEFIDHTADVGLRVYGKDLKQIFIHAAKGLLDLVVVIGMVHKRTKVAVKVSASSLDELLVAWLRELLYLVSTRQMVMCDFRIRRLHQRKRTTESFQLEAEVWGEKINFKTHVLKKEVKAVTYHRLSLKRKKNGWVAEVIFDV